MRRLLTTGLLSALTASATTALAAALARAAGVDFEVSGGEEIPPGGVAVVTGFLSLVGVGIAAALHRWSARPADRFVATTASLTAISLAPPFLSGGDAATVATLVGLHLLAAAVVIPVLARCLRVGRREAVPAG